MFCPRCRSEFREGFTRCRSCDCDLVEEKDLPPEPGSEDYQDLLLAGDPSEDASLQASSGVEILDGVVVFETTDPFLVTAVGDLLSEQGIEFSVVSAGFGKGRPSAIFGAGIPAAEIPTRILVSPDDAEETQALLDDFNKVSSQGNPVYSELPRELAEATEEPGPDSESDPDFPPDPDTESKSDDYDDDDDDDGEEGDPDSDTRDLPDIRDARFCPFCGARLNPTPGDLLEGKIPCRECGKNVQV